MSSTRKKISIHDYPEHLNPFSEPTVPLRKATGKVFVDGRPNMSGTWSSKITKRVNRSVTWIEKSWLGIEDSKKYKIQSAKTAATSVKSNHGADSSNSDDVGNESRPAQLADSNSNEKRGDSDYQQVRERIHETIVNPNEMISSAKKCDEERKEIKKKKKRPAPQPPSAAADACCTPPSENSHSASIRDTSSSEKNQKEMDDSTANACVENHFTSHSLPVDNSKSSYSTSCESENADSGVDSRPFSESSAYEPSSPSKSENEDSEGASECNGNRGGDKCAAPTTAAVTSRPNRPSRNKEDGEAKLSSADDKNESPKEADEEEPRRCSTACEDRSTSQHTISSINAHANDDYGDDEVFVKATMPASTAEGRLDEDDANVPRSCEAEISEESGSSEIDSRNGDVKATVQV